MAGNLLAMPTIVINMGGEMLYILEQRIKAQKIPEQKGFKVIGDIIKTMFYSKFISELFKPQETYSLSSTRHIFERLAHSSIMRLNESSMDKLFDLMTMGFKSQILWCSCPEEITQINQNHVKAIYNMIPDNAQLIQLVSAYEELMIDFYNNLTTAKFQQLREELLYFFQDRKVKISLFLQEETQGPDGTIYLKNRGQLPLHNQSPGMITYTDGRQTMVRLASDGCYTPGPSVTSRITTDTYSTLGQNLYCKQKTKTDKSLDVVEGSDTPLKPPRNPEKGIKELNKLAEILGTLKSEDPGDQNFKLDFMFAGNIWSSQSEVSRVQTETNANMRNQMELDKVRNELDEGIGIKNQEEEDLLDLIGH